MLQKHSRGCRCTDVSVRMGHTVTRAGGQLQEEASAPGTAERWPPGHHGLCAGPPPANSHCAHSGGEGASGCCHCSCDARISLASVTPCAALVSWPISPSRALQTDRKHRFYWDVCFLPSFSCLVCFLDNVVPPAPPSLRGDSCGARLTLCVWDGGSGPAPGALTASASRAHALCLPVLPLWGQLGTPQDSTCQVRSPPRREEPRIAPHPGCGSTHRSSRPGGGWVWAPSAGPAGRPAGRKVAPLKEWTGG